MNRVVLDSQWEAELCRVVESHPRVVAYTKNHNLGFEVPYRYGSEVRRYRPDFIVLVDDGPGPDDLLRLVIETKGYPHHRTHIALLARTSRAGGSYIARERSVIGDLHVP